jgi:hypothetical protein
VYLWIWLDNSVWYFVKKSSLKQIFFCTCSVEILFVTTGYVKACHISADEEILFVTIGCIKAGHIFANGAVCPSV